MIIGPFYHYLEVNTKPVNLGKNPAIEAFLYSLIVKHYDSGTRFLPEEEALFKDIFSVVNNPSVDAPTLKEWSKLADSLEIMARTVLKLTLRSPGVTLEYLLKRTNYIFQVFQPYVDRVGYVATQNDPNEFGLSIDSKLPGARSFLTTLANLTKRPKTDWFFWRNAFWMYLLVFAAVVASVRSRSWKYGLALLPVMLNALPLILFSGGQIYRYIIPTIWVSTLLSGYLLFIPGIAKTNPNVQPHSIDLGQ
jgi:hypothetical protein